MRDFRMGRLDDWRGVAVESDDEDAVEGEAWANGVRDERVCGVRIVDGTIVFVEVVESEDDEDDDDGAGEYGREDDVECNGGKDVEIPWCGRYEDLASV